MLASILVLLAISIASARAGQQQYTDAALADQIHELPGADFEIPFNQFSGYLKASETKNLHYWFTESLSNPETDPLAFWTNGGPGCSGLLGFMTEQGSFRVNKDLSLSLNEYAWNSVANMVYIEAPCGVGFSYSDNKDDYHTDDDQTAKDNYALIQQFLERFPQYKKNDLYITSESYGGHYMPTLAKEIVDQNAVVGSDSPQYVNFKGFAVGNPATTVYSTIPASVETYWGHQLIPQPLWDRYSEKCLKGQLKWNFETCEMLFVKMFFNINSALNPYALDYPVCTDDSRRTARSGRASRTWFLNHQLESFFAYHGNSSSPALESLRDAIHLQPVDGYEPCAEDYATTWLNQPAVKTAIHVKDDIVWQDCSRSLRYKQTDGMKDMTSYYQYLIDGNFGLDILVYSGDDDDVCATVGTQSWIWGLGYHVSERDMWQVWEVNQQTAGYLTKWKKQKFAFATVHGAGHEVPAYKPKEALWLFTEYLKGSLTN